MLAALAAARLTAPPGSPVLAEHRRRNIDFLGETALFSIFTGFNPRVRLFWRGGDLCG